MHLTKSSVFMDCMGVGMGFNDIIKISISALKNITFLFMQIVIMFLQNVADTVHPIITLFNEYVLSGFKIRYLKSVLVPFNIVWLIQLLNLMTEPL